MKQKYTLFAAIVLLALLCSVCGCSGDPPARSEESRDPSEYLVTNAYVQEVLATISPVCLPPELPECASVVEYHYAYDCAWMGMPNFSVKLVLQYSSMEDYSREQERIAALAASAATVEEDAAGARYYFGTTLHGLQMLTDDRIEDGNGAKLQFVFFEDSTQTVTYAIGMVYDGSTHHGDIVEIAAAK